MMMMMMRMIMVVRMKRREVGSKVRIIFLQSGSWPKSPQAAEHRRRTSTV